MLTEKLDEKMKMDYFSALGLLIWRDFRAGILILAMVLGWIACPVYAAMKTVQLAGYGASFPSSVYRDWMSAYTDMRSRHVHLDMTYTSTGSTKGIQYITGA